MKTLFTSLFTFFIVLTLNAQLTPLSNWEKGVSLSIRQDNFSVVNNKPTSRLNYEGGFFFLNRISEKVSLSLGMEIAFFKSDAIIFDRLLSNNFFLNISDPVSIFRKGSITDLQNLKLVLPVVLRWQIVEKVPAYFIVGINPHFSISTKGNLVFEEIEYDNVNEIELLKTIRREELNFSNYNDNELFFGIGINISKFKIDLLYQSSFFDLKNEDFNNIRRKSIVVRMNYIFRKN